MNLAGAEDDDLLFRPAVFAEQLEQVGAHRRRAHVDEQLVVEVLAGVFVLGEVFLGDRLAGLDVGGLGGEDLCLGENAGVDGGLALDDFAGGEVAVFLRLDQRVLVDRLAEVGVVVGGDFGVFFGLVLATRGAGAAWRSGRSGWRWGCA